MRLTPLVSVLMPSFQQAGFIRQSIESVQAQTHTDWELLVQDGGSKDGTCDLLSEMSKQDTRIRWVSEPDRGPADALNRALARHRGTIIAWLNSDDLLMPDAFESAIDHFTWHPAHLMVYGNADHIDAGGKVISAYPTLPINQWMLLPEMTCRVCQPSVMFKHSMVSLLGKFDTSLRAAFDFEYWLRVMRFLPGRVGFINQIRAQSRLHDSTITARQRSTVALEGMRVVHRHVGSVSPQWIYTWIEEQKRNLPQGQPGADPVAELRQQWMQLLGASRNLLSASDFNVLSRLRVFQDQ